MTGPDSIPCPAPATLALFAEGLVDDAGVAEHIGRCGPCARQIEEARTAAGFMHSARELMSAGQPGPAVTDEPPGYWIQRELDRGGQSVVYSAVQTATGRRVALKIQLRRIHEGPAARRRFEREIEVIASLRHPNLVTLFDGAALPDGRCYLAMELVEGVHLDEWAERVRTGSTDPRRNSQALLDAFCEVCEGVQYAHHHGVIHRDIKPANIVVDPDGHPRLLDFGLAKPAGPDAVMLTQEGQFAGTLAYASPEQIGGHSDRVDTRTDVYSLGVVLFQLVTGRLPYSVEGSIASAVDHIARSEPAFDPARDGPIPDDLRSIIRTAMAKDVDRRYGSPAELAADVRRFLRGDAVSAKRDSTLYVLRKAVWRWRLPLGIAACVGTVLLALLARQAAMAGTLEREKASLAASLLDARLQRGRARALAGQNAAAEQDLWRSWFDSGLACDFSPQLGVSGTPEQVRAFWALSELYAFRPCVASLMPPAGLHFGRVRLCGPERVVTLGSDDCLVTVGLPRLSELARDCRTHFVGSRWAQMSPDAGWIAVAGPRSIELRSLLHPDRNFTIQGMVAGIAWEARERLALVVSEEGEQSLYDLTRQALVWRVGGPPIQDGTRAMAICPDGSKVAVLAAPDLVSIRDARTGGEVRTLAVPERLIRRTPLSVPLNSLEYTPDGSVLLGTYGGHLIAWPEDTSIPTGIMENSSNGFIVIGHVSRDPPFFVTLESMDATLRVWRLKNSWREGEAPMELSAEYPSYGDGIRHALLTDDGGLCIVNGSSVGDLRAWETRPSRWLESTRTHGSLSVHCVAYAPWSDGVVTGGADGTVRVFDGALRPVGEPIATSMNLVADVDVSDDGRTIVYCGYPTGVVLQDALANTRIQLKGPSRPAHASAIDSKRGRVYAIETGGAVKDVGATLWEWDIGPGASVSAPGEITGRSLLTFGPPSFFSNLSLSHDGTHLLLARRSAGGCMVVSLPEGRVIAELGDPGMQFRDAQYSPDDSMIATASNDFLVTLWDARTFAMRRELVGATNQVFSISFHPGGNLLASGERSGAVHLWDTRTGTELATLASLDQGVFAVSFLPDGRRLAAVTGDGRVLLWDLLYYSRHIAGNALYWQQRGSRFDQGEPATSPVRAQSRPHVPDWAGR